jgi:hypothetical protein
MIQIRVFYSDNFIHASNSYVAPRKVTVVDLERYFKQFNKYGWSAWAEIEVVS